MKTNEKKTTGPHFFSPKEKKKPAALGQEENGEMAEWSKAADC